jgi:hypothetical protein
MYKNLYIGCTKNNLLNGHKAGEADKAGGLIPHRKTAAHLRSDVTPKMRTLTFTGYAFTVSASLA